MPLLRRFKKPKSAPAEPQLSNGQSVVVGDAGNISHPPKARKSSARTLLEQYRPRSSSSRGSLELSSTFLPGADAVFAQRHPTLLPSDPATPIPTVSTAHVVSTESGITSPENISAVRTSHTREDTSDLGARRTTRSQSRSRRQSRTDSQQIDPNARTLEKANIDIPNEQDTAHSMVDKKHASDAPRSLCIRKKPEAPLTPSPRPLPDRDTERPSKSSALEASQSSAMSPKPLKLLIPVAPKKSPAPKSPARESPVAAPPKGASMKERLAFVKARSPSPPLDDACKVVAVRPPIYDLRKGVCQWTSDLPSTSRPDREWEWPKRWTCCRCEATTIVEQKVCASLSCSHYRCPNECRLIRVARPPGQFVSSGA